MHQSDEHLARILIVDDDIKIARVLQEYMETQGFHVEHAVNAGEFRVMFSADRFDIVLLDLGLPDTDGFALAAELRSRSDIALIMLTGRSDMVDRVVGIEIGADDYMTKPFHLREVVARVKAVLRRVRGARESHGAPGEDGSSCVITFMGLRLLVDKRRLLDKDGRDVSLTGGEFELLRVLVENAGRILTRDQLIDMTKGHGWVVLDRTIDAQIARLRKKIEEDPKRPVFIKSVRGVGYVFSEKTRVTAS